MHGKKYRHAARIYWLPSSTLQKRTLNETVACLNTVKYSNPNLYKTCPGWFTLKRRICYSTSAHQTPSKVSTSAHQTPSYGWPGLCINSRAPCLHASIKAALRTRFTGRLSTVYSTHTMPPRINQGRDGDQVAMSLRINQRRAVWSSVQAGAVSKGQRLATRSRTRRSSGN